MELEHSPVSYWPWSPQVQYLHLQPCWMDLLNLLDENHRNFNIGREADSVVFHHWAGCLARFLRSLGCHAYLVSLGCSVFAQQAGFLMLWNRNTSLRSDLKKRVKGKQIIFNEDGLKISFWSIYVMEFACPRLVLTAIHHSTSRCREAHTSASCWHKCLAVPGKGSFVWRGTGRHKFGVT